MIEHKTHRSEVDVLDDITPFTQEKIPHVNSNQWRNYDIHDLEKQLTILQNRYTICMQMGKIEMAQQIYVGIQYLEEMINTKTIKRGR